MSPLLIAASLFAFVSSITPGPNNTMALASGANFGFARSVPHWLGIGLGFGVMLIAVGLGLNQVLAQFPAAYDVLRWVGAAYLLYLAWKLATATGMGAEAAASARPISFISAAAFQWVNPKAWVMAVTAMSTYLPAHAGIFDVLLLTVLFVLINLPCVGVWVGSGMALRRFLQDPKRLRAFNIGMAVMLVASLYPMLA